MCLKKQVSLKFRPVSETSHGTTDDKIEQWNKRKIL